MSSVCIYLDESGDLGWTFDKPYHQGGSSRYLTIAALVVSADHKHFPKRVIKKLYRKFKWDTSTEVKWSSMKPAQRLQFAHAACDLYKAGKSVKYFSITVHKENVQEHIRRDPNKLYNYMINLLLIEEMAKHESVTFLPDPRTIKVKSGNSLHDYLQTLLWFELKTATDLQTVPCESSASLNIQFADMLSGVIQSHFELGFSDPFNILRQCVDVRRLFFS